MTEVEKAILLLLQETREALLPCRAALMSASQVKKTTAIIASNRSNSFWFIVTIVIRFCLPVRLEA